MPNEDELRNCPGCAVAPGEFHEPGCDVERCPRCKGQMISCDCVYEINDMAVDTMEELHPDIYNDGPTVEMWAKWSKEWGHKLERWTGIWPGVLESRKRGWYSRMIPGKKGWHQCEKDDEGASEDLNRWAAYSMTKAREALERRREDE